MDIDDEFQEYMRLAHPTLSQADPQYAISRNTFFAGMTAMYGVLFGAKPKQQVRVLMDVRQQLARHAERVAAGMEPGFTSTNF